MKAGDSRFLVYSWSPRGVVKRQGTKISEFGFKFYLVTSMETFRFHMEYLRFPHFTEKKS